MSGESSLIVRFGADTAGLDSAVAVAKAQLGAFNAEVRKLAKEAAASGGAVDDNLAKALREASAGAAGMHALGPQFLARTAVERDESGKTRAFQRFAVHESQHEHFVAGIVLNDRGDQAIVLGKVEVHFLLPKNKKPAGGLRACGLMSPA